MLLIRKWQDKVVLEDGPGNQKQCSKLSLFQELLCNSVSYLSFNKVSYFSVYWNRLKNITITLLDKLLIGNHSASIILGKQSFTNLFQQSEVAILIGLEMP